MITWETYRLQGCENVGRMHFTPPHIFTLINTAIARLSAASKICRPLWCVGL